MPIDALPTLSRSSPTFKADCDAFFGTKLPAFSAQAEAARQQIVAAESSSAASAADALSSQTAAQNAAATAAAAAAFKGNWASLAGSLAMPACVKHAGRFWLLVSNLPDVAAATPGVSSAWIPLDSGSQQYNDIAVNTAASALTRYRLTASLNLTLPAAPADGDWVDVVNHSGTTTARVMRNGQNIMGLAEDMTIGLLNVAITLVFKSGYGWFIK